MAKGLLKGGRLAILKGLNKLKCNKIMIKAILCVLTGFIFLWVVNIGISKQEALECQQWRKDAEVYEGFYWENWQIEQCKNY